MIVLLIIATLLNFINDQSFAAGIDLTPSPLSPYLIEENISFQDLKNVQTLKENLLFERPRARDIFKDAKSFHKTKKAEAVYDKKVHKLPSSIGQLTIYNDIISDRKKLTFILPKGEIMKESITFYSPKKNIDKLRLRTLIDPVNIKQNQPDQNDSSEKHMESQSKINYSSQTSQPSTENLKSEPPSSTFSYFERLFSSMFPIFFNAISRNGKSISSTAQNEESYQSNNSRNLKDDRSIFTNFSNWIISSWTALKYWIQNGLAYLNTSNLSPNFEEFIKENLTNSESINMLNELSSVDSVIYSNRLLIGWICNGKQENKGYYDKNIKQFDKNTNNKVAKNLSEIDPEISLYFGLGSEDINMSDAKDAFPKSENRSYNATRMEIIEFFGEDNIISFKNIYTRKKFNSKSETQSAQFCSVDLIILREDLFGPEDFFIENDFDCSKEADHKTMKSFISHFSCPKYKDDILFIFPDAPIKSNFKEMFMSPSSYAINERALYSIPNEPLQSKQWFLDAPSVPCAGSDCFLSGQSSGQSYGIDVYSAWEILKEGGPKVLVALIDTGVNYLHEDLKSSIWVNQAELDGIAGYDDDGNGYVDDLYGWNFINENNNPMDDNGHGSHIAGIIGANSNNQEGVAGICHSSQIMVLKILDRNGDGDVSSAIPAIQYAIDNGAQIISNSWGGLAGSSRNAILGKMLEKMVDYSSNSVFIMASGNNGKDITDELFYPASIKRDWSLTVGANSQDGTIPNWSNSGAKNVHLTAPGNKITSTWKGAYTISSGTSMAAPMATGVSCLILNQYPKLKPQQVIDIMIESTIHIPAHTRQTITSGILNAYNSLKISPFYFYTLSTHELSLSRSTGGMVYPKSFEVMIDPGELPIGDYWGLIEFSYLPESYLGSSLFTNDYGSKISGYIVIEMHIVEDYLPPQVYVE